MAYCFNCGHKVNDDDVFCENCGTRLIDEQPTHHCDKSNGQTHTKGVLYTNIQRLAENLHCTCIEVESLLNDYINVLQRFGVFYSVLSSTIDSDDYNDYVEEVYDNIEPDTKCLFIVGGCDVIPMACLENPVDDNDIDVDTDLPYAIMSPNASEANYYDGSIMSMDLRLDVGRFPTGKGNTIDDLRNYLKNSINAFENVISIDSAYGQANPFWNIETDIVAEDLRDNSRINVQISNPDFYHNNLVMTPYVTEEYVDRFISRNTDLLLFNLHGSCSPGAAGFYGEDGEGGFPAGVLPKHFAHLENLNVVVTEACYGARFDGFTKNSSILLSALGNKTIGYLGSSRTAFCSGLSDPIECDYIDNADFFCKYFIRNLLFGSTLGNALNDTRIAYQYRCYDYGLTPCGLTSFMEFNLLGDPAIPIDGGLSYLKSKNLGTHSPKHAVKMMVSDVDYGGILSAVRNAINRSRNEIHKIMIEKLYKEFGLDSKNLKSIKDVSCYGGRTSKDYHYIYKREIGDFTRYDIAIADSKSNIKRIITSK